MWQKIGFGFSVAALIVIGAQSCVPALAQNSPAPSLKDQLAAQYKLARAEVNSGTVTVVKSGTVLILQKGGLLGVPPTSIGLCASDYKDGALQPAGGLCKAMFGANSRPLDMGEKVYPMGIEVNLKKDRVSLFFMECDSCNGLTQQSSYKATVNFDFPKGYLGSADAGQVEDVISQVLSIDNSTSAAQQNQSLQTQQAPSPQQAPTAQPQTVELGQTVEQVEAVLGQPDKKITIGSKLIYIYKDVKVTFVDGKVSDAQ